MRVSWEPRSTQYERDVTRSKFYEELVEELRRKTCCHKSRESLFSSSSGFYNYRGILNWAVIVLILTHAHMVLENLMTYGFLVDPVNIVAFLLSDPYTWPAPYMIAVANIFIFAALHVERSLSAMAMSERSGHTFQMSNLAVILILPLFVLNVLTSATAGGSMMVLIVYSILLLKLYSYHEVNKWLREEWAPLGLRSAMKKPGISSCANRGSDQESRSDLVTYPDNLTVADLYYFLLAPTLCYQMNFPRSPKIRMRFLLRRILEMFFMTQLILGLIQQWILPVTRATMKPFTEMELTLLVDHLLLLAIPNHFIWIVFFYGFFHSTLNFIAELMQFADRRFYRDWWNSQTLTYYWSNSNMLLHKWSVRHIYRPMIENGYTKWEGQASVFVLSALFHEYLIAVPFRMLRLWLFTGMMLQVLIAWVLSRYLKGLYGNAIVWLCIILGPPLGVLTYIHDYYVFEQLKINQNK
eukprot:gi/632972944/ref/XP_007902907.1/ PREDICTED: diacylglycerol O-acyltransferase 1-like [Callorhinchus milii]